MPNEFLFTPAPGTKLLKSHFRTMSQAVTAETVKGCLDLQQFLNHTVGGDVTLGEVVVDKGLCNWTLGGVDVTIPISMENACLLHSTGDTSLVGIEGQGDVHNPNIRSSHELTASLKNGWVLPPKLITFDFPEAVEEIHRRLCPTAEQISLRPYKLITYEKNDFFAPHVDSMTHAMQFGTLALQLPVSRAEENSARQADNEAATNDTEDSVDATVESTGESMPGELVFYVGRDVDGSRSTAASFTNVWRNKHSWATYGRAKDELIFRVDLNTPLPARPDGSVALKYGAWLGDIRHEVTRVKDSYRIVLIYRIFKKGHVALSIPRSQWSAFDTLYATVRRSFPIPVRAQPAGCAVLGPIESIGVVLRHGYPPAGLTPEALKGIDAVAYEFFSLSQTCLLFNGYACRDGLPSNPFQMQYDDRGSSCGAVIKRVFQTTDDIPHMFELEREATVSDLMATYPVFLRCLWLELGFGTLVGGGHSYGNADCGADWWYRTAVMIVTKEPSHWIRRRPLVLAGLRGVDTMRRLWATRDVFTQVLSFL